jgi:uncharacterized protein (TIGR00299 family) protein
MKTAYFHCFAGISGDMITGALLDAGADFSHLKSELEKLQITGFEIAAKKVIKNGISGTKFSVNVTGEQPVRKLPEIENIISTSKLEASIKKRSLEIFWLLAEAESAVHNISLEEVHFHEVGAVDAIVDIVSACITLKDLGVERVFSSPLHLGTGYVDTMHGKLPVPAPATMEILKEKPVYSTGINSELTTPTGAAIISVIAEDFINMPSMNLESTGYGAGTRDLPVPNLLRILTGELIEERHLEDTISCLETNIDDMNPEFFPYVMDKLMKNGALDVYLQPVIMKKSRPGTLLKVLTQYRNEEKLADIIFRETTTSGIRFSTLRRRKLARETGSVATPFGEVAIKVHYREGEVITLSPEYESCKKIADKAEIPIKEVYTAAQSAAKKKFKNLKKL